MSRLSVCYAAPGHALLGTSGSTRNVLSVAEALREHADVTVAFRSVAEPLSPSGYRLVAIEPAEGMGAQDDVAVRGLNPLTHARYLRTVRRFARRSVGAYDLVFEKGWRFSGFLSRQFGRIGVPAVLIENDVRFWNEPTRDFRSLARYAAQTAAQALAGHCSRQVPLIIAETSELKEALIALRGIAPERIEVVGLGVDHALFRPRDQAEARRRLGIDGHATVLLYVGGLDIYHDLGPMIAAFGRVARSDLALHVVGDGELRASYEAAARGLRGTARFHGQVPHQRVPDFIAASDLCLAPYQPARFYANRIAFSTLKIPEYMACERPVASVPQGHIAELIEDRVSGFLLANDVAAWAALLDSLPSRSELARMGERAARRVAPLSWANTAAGYMEVSRRLLETRPN